MENYFLSLIIPVYKVEKYLNQCVDSVICQNIKDIEIILVDDGSPDNSGKICDEYANKYDYIKVIHKENGGLSSARNAGLKVSSGEYVAFMDSDDWWNEKVNVNSLLEKVKSNKDTEIFFYLPIYYTEGKGFYSKKSFEDLDKRFIDNDIRFYYQNLINFGSIGISACCKFIKKDFLLKNNLFFLEGILSEDCEWTIRAMRNLSKFKLFYEPLYVYRKERTGSISNSIKKKNIDDLLSIVLSSIKFNKENTNELLNEEYGYCAYIWSMALGLNGKLTKKEQKEEKPIFKKTSFVCKYANVKKTKFTYLIYKFLGYRLTVNILLRYLNGR